MSGSIFDGVILAWVRVGGVRRLVRIAPSDIKFCKAYAKLVDVVKTDGKTVVVDTSLTKLIAGLDGFMQVHRAYIVNIDYLLAHGQLIFKENAGGAFIKVDDDLIPVSRRSVASVRRVFKGWRSQVLHSVHVNAGD